MIPGELVLIKLRTPLFAHWDNAIYSKGTTSWTKDKLELAFVIATGGNYFYGGIWVQIITDGKIVWTLSKWLNYDTR